MGHFCDVVKSSTQIDVQAGSRISSTPLLNAHLEDDRDLHLVRYFDPEEQQPQFQLVEHRLAQ